MDIRQHIDNGTLPAYKLYTVSSSRSTLWKVNRIEAIMELQGEDMQRLFFTDEEIEFLFMCHEVYAKGRSGIVYVINEEHAHLVCKRFCDEGMKAKSCMQEGVGYAVMVGDAIEYGCEEMPLKFIMLAYPTRELDTYLLQTVYGLSKGITQQPVILLDCVGMYHRFGFPDKKRSWDKIEKDRTRCASRTLGEEVSCSLMMEIDKPVRPKPYEIISTDGNGISVFKEKRYGLCGLMGKDENIVCEAEYDEIGVTPYGWYIGVSRYENPNAVFSTLIDIMRGKQYRFGEIKRIDDFLYEAEVFDDETNCEVIGKIRFNGFLKLIPTGTFVLNGITIYNVSSIVGMNIFTVSLSLDARRFDYCYKKGRGRVEMLECGTGHAVTYKKNFEF